MNWLCWHIRHRNSVVNMKLFWYISPTSLHDWKTVFRIRDKSVRTIWVTLAYCEYETIFVCLVPVVQSKEFCLNVRLKLFSRNLCESRPDCAIVNQRQEKLLSKRNCYIVGTPRQQWQREISTLSTMINYKGLREKETKKFTPRQYW